MRRFLPLLIFPALLDPVTSWGVTRFVDPGPTTIHEAMAQSSPGDSVVLRAGTYSLSQAVAVRPGVVVTSVDGPATTILDMQFRVRGFILDGLGIPPVISGLTFLRGVGPVLELGGAILSFDSSPEIRNCLFAGNQVLSFEGDGGNGAAVYLQGGAPILEGNTFVGNVCEGGALGLSGTAGRVRNNVFAYNVRSVDPPKGYGLKCENASTEISGNLFWANLPSSVAWCPGWSTNRTDIDPQFCAPVSWPFDGSKGDWRVMATSPLAPGGTWSVTGASLGTCAGTLAPPSTWGRIKSRYRD